LRELATRFEEYVAIHGVRSRRSGGDVYIQILLEFDGDRKMAEVQQTIDEMKFALEKKIPGSQVLIAPTMRY
jgi:divalent metal cation (Fe/Co/Zn/Cd) transporter